MSVSIDYIELRKSPRIAHHAPILLVQTAQSVGAEATGLAGEITDLSQGGAGLVMKQAFRLNEQVRIDGIDDGLGPREARVCWVRQSNSHYRIGIEFEPQAT